MKGLSSLYSTNCDNRNFAIFFFICCVLLRCRNESPGEKYRLNNQISITDVRKIDELLKIKLDCEKKKGSMNKKYLFTAKVV